MSVTFSPSKKTIQEGSLKNKGEGAFLRSIWSKKANTKIESADDMGSQEWHHTF